MQIHENGFWLSESTEGHADDNGLKNALLDLLKTEEVATLLDLGCGSGYYIKQFKEKGIRCTGFDGNPNTPQLTEGLGSVLDLSREVSLDTKYDCVLSLEVGEHIPELFETTFIDNITKHSSRLVIVSWAVPGQSGHGHVNCKSNEYIEASFKAKGFSRLVNYEKPLRESAEYYWFKNTIMVFSKQPLLNENAVTFDSYRNFKGYIINLDRELWRYGSAHSNLSRLGFSNLTRWKATDYKEEDVNEEFRRMGATKLERFTYDAEIATVLSHYRIWLNFLAGNDPYCLIFEDDVVAGENFKQTADFTDLHYGNFELLSFGGILLDLLHPSFRPLPHDGRTGMTLPLNEIKELQGNLSYFKNCTFNQTHAYLLSRKGAYKAVNNYLACLNSHDYKYPQIDHYLTRSSGIDIAISSNTNIPSKEKYRLTEHQQWGSYGPVASRICGILYQGADFPSTVQNY